MQNKYRYDAVDNILGITNATNPQGLTKLNKAKLGGTRCEAKKRRLSKESPSYCFVIRLGFEPKTPTLKVLCSTS